MWSGASNDFDIENLLEGDLFSGSPSGLDPLYSGNVATEVQDEFELPAMDMDFVPTAMNLMEDYVDDEQLRLISLDQVLPRSPNLAQVKLETITPSGSPDLAQVKLETITPPGSPPPPLMVQATPVAIPSTADGVKTEGQLAREPIKIKIKKAAPVPAKRRGRRPGTRAVVAAAAAGVGDNKNEEQKWVVRNAEEPAPKKRRGRPAGSKVATSSAGGFNVEAKLLKIRPHQRRTKPRNIVPDEEKSAEYYEHRRKNTEAARRCRQQTRLLDQRRVEIIKEQAEQITELRAKLDSLMRENQLIREMNAMTATAQSRKGGKRGKKQRK